MEEILKEIGMSEAMFIPMANEENKRLQFEVQELAHNKEDIQSCFDEDHEKLISLQKFIKSILTEQGENQKLLTTFDHQLQSDEIELKVSQNEVKNCNSTVVSLKKKFTETIDSQDSLQTENDRTTIRIDKLKAHLHWDKAALELWEEDVARGSEDTELLAEFTKQDLSRFNDMELRRKTLREEVGAKRRKLEIFKDDVLCLEKSLEKTGYIFQKQQADRQSLVAQWEASVRVLHQRDDEINRRMEEVGGLRAQAKQRMRDLVEHKTFFENEARNNRELERDLARTTRDAHSMKENVQELDSTVSDMYGQMMVLRGSLSTTANAIQRHRTTCRRMNDDILKKRHLNEKLVQRLENLHVEMEAIKSKSSSSAGRVEQLESLRMDEIKTTERLTSDCSKLQEILRRATEELMQLKNQDKEQRSLMTGIESNIVNVRKRTHAAMEEQQRQSEMLYAADMSYVEKEIQYKKMLGASEKDDKENDERKVADLEEVKAKCQETNDLLQNERYRLEQEQRRLITAIHHDATELNSLRSKKQENLLMAEGAHKQLKALQAFNQNRQVDENVIKLRVKQVQRAVDRVGDKLYTLEKQRLELDEAVKERGMEVESLMDVLNVRKRVLLEQCSALKSKINIAKLKVEHLHKRYDVSISSMGSGEDDEMQSITYYKIKAAQERYELQQFGDKLDDKIRKTEKEIQAMENTLKLVHLANRNFKGSLSQLAGDSLDMREKESLESTYLEVLSTLRSKKAILQALNESTARLEGDMQAQLELEARITKDWKERDGKAAELATELVEQEKKLNRAARSLKKLIKEVRGTQQTRFQTPEERDIDLRELLEQNQSALQQMSEVVIRHAETGPVVLRYLQEKGLHLPDIPSARICTSGRQSLSSRSSGSVASRSCLTIDSTTLDGVESLRRFSPKGLSPTSSALRPEKRTVRTPSVEVVDVTCEEAK